MSDSRDEGAQSPGGNQSGTRASGRDKRSRRGARGQAAPTGEPQSTTPNNKVRVRIDPAHAIGDAPPDASADTPIAESIGPAAQAGEPIQSADPDKLSSSATADDSSPASAFDTLSDAISENGANEADDLLSLEKFQQLRLQLEQVAGHLRSQQYQLDRREAQLHSQLAQQENEIRTSRLWFREQRQELTEREAQTLERQQQTEAAQLERQAEREAQLLQREQELESQRAGLIENLSQREAELARRESDFDSRSAAWAKDRSEWIDAQTHIEAECRDAKQQWQEQADALAVKHRELEQDRQSIARQLQEAAPQRSGDRNAPYPAANGGSVSNADQPPAEIEALDRQVNTTLDVVRQFLAGEQLLNRESANASGSTMASDMPAVLGELRAAIAKLASRQKNLEEAEALLIDGQAALEQNRRQFAAGRQSWHEHCELERRRLADDRRRAEAEMEKKLRAITERGEHLQRRTAAVDQLRAEVLRAQRETLELRLATDEIWAQFAGSVPPPVLTQSMARIRSKLAEQYQLERAELAERQKQLEALAGRLDSQREKLNQQKLAFEQWLGERRGEIEGQASRLVAQELEIARRQSELEEQSQQQQSERRIYEAEIRRLLGELRRDGRTAMAAA